MPFVSGRMVQSRNQNAAPYADSRRRRIGAHIAHDRGPRSSAFL